MSDLISAARAQFGRVTSEALVERLGQFGIPVPQDREYLDGATGFMIFLPPFGSVLRIEEKVEKIPGYAFHRVDHPRILQPIGTVDLGNAYMEICPGLALNVTTEDMRALKEKLAQDDILFWDAKTANCGYLPVKTEAYPRGIPVVIDRGAVRKLLPDRRIAPACAETIRDESWYKVDDPGSFLQKELYAPLTCAFEQALETNNMAQFWEVCAAHTDEKAEGTKPLTAGWLHASASGPSAAYAASSSRRFSERLENERATKENFRQ